VNQLLSMIDGVNSLNNILVIGMTNRKDMIDEVGRRCYRPSYVFTHFYSEAVSLLIDPSHCFLFSRLPYDHRSTPLTTSSSSA
jgi:hypothetical protein